MNKTLKALIAIVVICGVTALATLVWPLHIQRDASDASSQPVASSTYQMQTWENTALGKRLLADAGHSYMPFQTVTDPSVPGGNFQIDTVCDTTVTTSTNHKSQTIGSNYTKCSASSVQQMTSSQPGLIVNDGNVVAIILPTTGKNKIKEFYWVAVPVGDKIPTAWQSYKFPSGSKGNTMKASMLSVMQRVPLVLGNYSSASISVTPFDTTVGAGVITQVNLAKMVETVTS